MSQTYLQMRIFVYICILLSSLFAPTVLSARPYGNAGAASKNIVEEEPDTLPFFRGVAVSVDVAGPLLMYLSDYGQYEAALRVNIRDRYFPVFELGYGIGKHDVDPITGVEAESKAPFGRIGLDFNIKKQKHDDYRLYGGFRYGYTSFNMNIANHTVTDPVYGGDASYEVKDERCNYHWLEGVFGVDAKIAGPFRMGWSVRYRRKLASSDATTGAMWYVPGYGTDSSSHWGGTFNLTFEL